MRVSIIIPCFNQGPLLSRSVDSALLQAKPGLDLEVIVVNDGSTDCTSSVISAYGRRIVSIEQRNAGLSAARNAGITMAGGDFLLFLDSDDWLEADGVHTLVTAAEQTNADILHGKCRLVTPSGAEIGEFDARSVAVDPFHQLLRGNLTPVHAHLVRRSVIESGLRFDPDLRSYEDWDFWLQAAAAGARFLAVPELICSYLKYPESMSGNWRRMLENGHKVLEKHSRTHGDCEACRAALRRGQRNLRYNTMTSIFAPRLWTLVKARRLGESAQELARAMAYDPLIARVWLLEWPLIHGLSAIKRAGRSFIAEDADLSRADCV